jgi:ribosomal protein L11 methyltransferase
MNYECWLFKVEPVQPGSEILIAILGDRGFDSFESTEDGFKAYIPENLAAGVSLTDLDFSEFHFRYQREAIAAVNWNEQWEKNFKPVRIGDQLIIRSSFHEPEKGFVHEILITPKMSFGTGHHNTTQMMCEAMLELEMKGQRVLDMGCGTGVLAILAAKLGAADVVGIDIDEWSVTNAQENCSENGFPHIVIRLGGEEKLADESPFDIILANINKNILKKQMSLYKDKLKPGGTLLISGFFVSDTDDLKSTALQQGMEFLKALSKDEWALLVFKKA